MKMCWTISNGSIMRYHGLLWAYAWLMVCVSAIAHADRDIVYAATSYRWSGHLYQSEYGGRPQRTLEATGSSHLYRINPDGTGRTQLTFGRYDDFDPHFSPDGKNILFSRRLYSETYSLCLIASEGGPLTKTWRI